MKLPIIEIFLFLVFMWHLKQNRGSHLSLLEMESWCLLVAIQGDDNSHEDQPANQEIKRGQFILGMSCTT